MQGRVAPPLPNAWSPRAAASIRATGSCGPDKNVLSSTPLESTQPFQSGMHDGRRAPKRASRE